MNSVSNLIKPEQVQSFLSSIKNFPSNQESAIIDFAILLQSGRTGDTPENYFYPQYTFTGELIKIFTWKNAEDKPQYMYFFMVDWVSPETGKPATICIKLFGASAFDTQMKKATIGDTLTVKFLGQKPNPNPKKKPFLSYYISGFSNPSKATATETATVVENPEKKNSNENDKPSESDDLPF